MAFSAEVNRVDVEADQSETGGSAVPGLLFATFLMLAHNPKSLWEITVKQSSPITMLLIVIIREKPVSQ